jgi:hypothetical protein
VLDGAVGAAEHAVLLEAERLIQQAIPASASAKRMTGKLAGMASRRSA